MITENLWILYDASYQYDGLLMEFILTQNIFIDF